MPDEPQDGPIIRTRHRADGWPLCPSCGNDGLDTLVPDYERTHYHNTLWHFFLYRWRCSHCSWDGYIETPPEMLR